MGYMFHDTILCIEDSSRGIDHVNIGTIMNIYIQEIVLKTLSWSKDRSGGLNHGYGFHYKVIKCKYLICTVGYGMYISMVWYVSMV